MDSLYPYGIIFQKTGDVRLFIFCCKSYSKIRLRMASKYLVSAKKYVISSGNMKKNKHFR